VQLGYLLVAKLITSGMLGRKHVPRANAWRSLDDVMYKERACGGFAFSPLRWALWAAEAWGGWAGDPKGLEPDRPGSTMPPGCAMRLM
jgi:hypothetical protein